MLLEDRIKEGIAIVINTPCERRDVEYKANENALIFNVAEHMQKELLRDVVCMLPPGYYLEDPVFAHKGDGTFECGVYVKCVDVSFCHPDIVKQEIKEMYSRYVRLTAMDNSNNSKSWISRFEVEIR